MRVQKRYSIRRCDGGLVFWTGAKKVYEECRKVGLCRSQRDFSRQLLGRGPHYLRLVTNRRGFVSEKTTRTLRGRLDMRRAGVDPMTAGAIDAILTDVSRASEMARWLRRKS